MEPFVIPGHSGDNPPRAYLYYGQDCRASLKDLPPQCVHMVATSPPYWGLRDYGNDPAVWGGDEACEHEWGDPVPQNSRHMYTDEYGSKEGTVALAGGYPTERGQYCKCGAWRGQLGLEPTPTCHNPSSNNMLLELRDDLTESEREFVFRELLKRGIIR